MSAPDPDDLLEQAMRYAEQRTTSSGFDIEQGLERLAREVRRSTPATTPRNPEQPHVLAGSGEADPDRAQRGKHTHDVDSATATAANATRRAPSGTTVIRAKDGRVLTFESWGAQHGVPVFLLHGTPGSRMGPHPRPAVLHRLGIRLIAYDRPGYSGSDPLPGRAVAHAAADVEAIADYLGLSRFAVIGRSGGAPHALACAALLPDRVTKAAVLVSLAPRNAEGLDWYAGMTPSNAAEYHSAEAGHHLLTERIRSYADHFHHDPAPKPPFESASLPAPDHRVLSDFGIRSMLVDNSPEALGDIYAGWIDDTMSFVAPWGFSVEAIKQPVLLWHSDLDVFSPVAHTRWLAEHIPGSSLVLNSHSAHFGAVGVLPQVLSWLAEGQQERV